MDGCGYLRLHQASNLTLGEKKAKRENKSQKLEHDPLNRLSVPPRGLRDVGGTKKLKARSAFIRVFILFLSRKTNAA